MLSFSLDTDLYFPPEHGKIIGYEIVDDSSDYKQSVSFPSPAETIHLI